MADGRGLSCLSEMGRAKSLENAVKLATGEGWLDTCRPLPIPGQPYHLASVRQDYLQELRSQNADDAQKTVAAYNAWVTAKSMAIADNECRLRGAMWCWRRLRQEYSENPDPAVKTMCRRVREFLRIEWGVDDPPMAYGAAHALAVETVAAMASVDDMRRGGKG